MLSVKKLLLETERLYIRPYRAEDFDACFALMQDGELFRYLDMQVMPKEEYRELFDWIIGCYNTPPHEDFKYSFNILRREDDAVVGWCGLGGASYDHAQKEIYWLIGSAYQRSGYCTEAASALLRYGFETLRLPRIIALAKPENAPSRRVMEKLGLRCSGTLTGLPQEFDWNNGEVVYALTREEYLRNADPVK